MSHQNSDGKREGYKAITKTLRLELSPNHLGRSPSMIRTIANTCAESTHAALWISCLKQYHQLFRAKGTNWGKFSVLLANHRTLYWIDTEIDLLTGQLKKRLNILIVVNDLVDNLRSLYNEPFTSLHQQFIVCRHCILD